MVTTYNRVLSTVIGQCAHMYMMIMWPGVLSLRVQNEQSLGEGFLLCEFDWSLHIFLWFCTTL